MPRKRHTPEETVAKDVARIIIESWRCFYNTLRPHGSPGYRPPAPEVIIPATARSAAPHQPASPPALAPKPSLHQHSTRITRWGLISRFHPTCWTPQAITPIFVCLLLD